MARSSILTGSQLKSQLDTYANKGINNFGVLNVALPDMSFDDVKKMFVFLTVSVSGTEFCAH